MLFLHETHEVAGLREQAFEAALRDEWMPGVARDEGARLLYYLNHAVGTGPSYRVVTITGLRDARAWERLATRVHEGDLRDLAVRIDDLRHDVHAKLLVPLPWSPLQEVDLGTVPAKAAEHELSLFMEDTVRPIEGRLEEYVARAGSHYSAEIASRRGERGSMLEIEGSFRTAFGAGTRREVILWQRITSRRGLLGLIAHEVPAQYKQPGGWMHDALSLRDQWQSRLLRTSAWSPLY